MAGKPEDIPEDVWDAAYKIIRAPIADAAGNHLIYFLGYEYEDKGLVVLSRAILEERKRECNAIVGHIMTVVESLMEGRMTDAGLTKLDHVKMRAQIEALEVVADEIQARHTEVNTAHKFSTEA